MMKRLAFFLMFFSNVSLAAPGAYHGDGVPTVVYWQLLNLAILFSGMYYFLKDKIPAHFSQLKKDFLEASERSKKFEKENESLYLGIKTKYEALVSGEKDSLERAKSESKIQVAQMISEAQVVAERLKRESREALRTEGLRTAKEIKLRAVVQSIQSAKSILEKDIAQQDHLKLQSDFANKIHGASL